MERSRRPRRTSTADRRPNRRSERSPGSRQPRERRLPPGFSRRSRNCSPASSFQRVERSRLVDEVTGVGRGSHTTTARDEEPSVRLPPHLQHAKRPSAAKTTDKKHQSKKIDSLDTIHPNTPQFPACNPFLLPFLGTGCQAHHRQLSPGRHHCDEKEYSLEDPPSRYPTFIGQDDRLTIDPHHGSPRPPLRSGTSQRRIVRRRSATPVLDIAAISQWSDAHESQSIVPDHAAQEHQTTQPKKKQKGRNSVVPSQGIEVELEKLPERGQGVSRQLESQEDLILRGKSETVPDDGDVHAHRKSYPQDVKHPQVNVQVMPIAKTNVITCDQYIAELRLLLAERMHQALESAIGKAQGDCGILEESIAVDFCGRFGRPLNFMEAGFQTVKDMIRSTCLDIVQMQQLKAGEVVKMGFIPTTLFKAEAGKVLAGVRDAYVKLAHEKNRVNMHQGCKDLVDAAYQQKRKSVDMPKSCPTSTSQQKKTPFMLAKMARNMLKSIMRDIVSGVWSSVTIFQFLEKFYNHYSVRLDAKDVGFQSIRDFLSHVDNSVKFQVINGVTHMFPSEKYLSEKPPVVADLHGRKSNPVAGKIAADNLTTRAYSHMVGGGVRMAVGNRMADANGEHEAPRMHSNPNTGYGIVNCMGSRKQHGGCQFSISSPSDLEGRESTPQQPIEADIEIQSLPSKVKERAGAKKLHTASMSLSASAIEQNPNHGVLLHSTDPQEVYRMLEQAVDAGIRKSLKHEPSSNGWVAETQSRSLDASGSSHAGGEHSGEVRPLPSTVPLAGTGRDVSYFSNMPTSKGYQEKESIGEIPLQISGYCRGGLNTHTAMIPEEGRMPIVEQNVSEVIGRIRELLKKAMRIDLTPVLLNRVPLLYFNEFHQVLDFVTLGFDSLADLMRMVDDLVIVTDGPAGQVLIPRKQRASKRSEVQHKMCRLPQSYPSEVQVRNEGMGSVPMELNQGQPLQSLQCIPVLGNGEQSYNPSGNGAHHLQVPSTQVLGSTSMKVSSSQYSPQHGGCGIQTGYHQLEACGHLPQYQNQNDCHDDHVCSHEGFQCSPAPEVVSNGVSDAWNPWAGHGPQHREGPIRQSDASLLVWSNRETNID